MMACPYQVRVYNERPREYYPGQGLTPYEEMREKMYPLQTGTVSKCNFCLERLDKALDNGQKPGLDREVTPACVNACPTKARIFGDLDDPESEISISIRVGKGYQLRPETGTDPCVFYITK